MGANRGAQAGTKRGAGSTSVTTEVGAGDVRGTIRVAPAVLFELIELAVREVPGVVGLATPRGVERIRPRGVHAATGDSGPPPGHPLGGNENRAGTTTYEANGLRVRLDGDRLDADVAIVVEPGQGIVELSRAIQQKVGAAAGRMLGMVVTDVNVFVADVASPAAGER